MKLIKDLGMVENSSGNRYRKGIYRCDNCNNDYELFTHNIKRNNNKICKKCTLVERNITHGLSREKSYEVWNNMIGRCYRKSNRQYKDWGGRGISVCDEWKNDYLSFKEWFDKNYSNGLQIDRINNDGNYEPSNCRFISRVDNLRNKRTVSGKKSKYRYIVWHGQSSGWRVKFNGRYIGYSKDEEVAYSMLKKDAEYIEYIKGKEIFNNR